VIGCDFLAAAGSKGTSARRIETISPDVLRPSARARARTARRRSGAMRTLTLRIYLTVVAVLALFAFASAWVFQRHIEEERTQANSVLSDRMAAWGELIQRSLPSVEAPHGDQAAALNDWSQRLRLPLALDSPEGERIGASESFLRRQADGASRGFQSTNASAASMSERSSSAHIISATPSCLPSIQRDVTSIPASAHTSRHCRSGICAS